MAFGPNAKQKYLESLQKLKELNSDGGISDVLATTYKKTARDRFFYRWKLVDILGALKSPESLRTLQAVSKQPVPDFSDKAVSHVGRTPTGEAIKIRFRALSGLGQIAETNPSVGSKIEEHFVSIAANTSRLDSIRLLAAQNFLRIDGNTSELKSKLPASDHNMLKMKTLTEEHTVQTPEIDNPINGEKEDRFND